MENLLKKIFRYKHRKYKRYKVSGGLTVVLDPGSPPGDEIVDIAMGGLTFNYVDQGKPLKEKFNIDIYADNKLVIEKIKVKLISNIEVGDIAFRLKHVRRISVQFLSLTPVQEFDLKTLIKSHGVE